MLHFLWKTLKTIGLCVLYVLLGVVVIAFIGAITTGCAWALSMGIQNPENYFYFAVFFVFFFNLLFITICLAIETTQPSK